MIFRDLYRCSPEDFHHALAESRQTLLWRGVVEPPSAIEPADVDRLLAHPDFDPSLSFVAYDGGEPVAFLASRIEGRDGERQAVWSLFGGLKDAGHAREMLLDEAMDHWRQAGARRVRKGRTGLLGTEPRRDEDADLIALLEDRGFEITAESVLMGIDLKKLSTSDDALERERENRRKGYYVRTAHPDEVALVARQYHPRHTGTLSLELWNEFVRHLRADALLVGEFHRQICGYAAYYCWTLGSERPTLGPSFVEEAHRSAGLGALLRHHTLAQAKEAGKARVQVHCPAAKARVYEKAGFGVEARFAHEAVAELD